MSTVIPLLLNLLHLYQFISISPTRAIGNANDDCYPQEKTPVAKMGLNYSTFAVALFAAFIILCCLVSLFLHHSPFGTSMTTSESRRNEDDTNTTRNDSYALSKIGKNSVYSYIVKELPLGWLGAFVTLGLQIFILAFFIIASEANLQDDKIDIKFTWKCPRDSHKCDNKADLTGAGWIIFSVLMFAFLAKDMINGCKLIYHSSRRYDPGPGPRIRYFIGGVSLCFITLFALYVSCCNCNEVSFEPHPIPMHLIHNMLVLLIALAQVSTVYNNVIASSNTEMILNSVVVLFVMEIDEYIFSALGAINRKWTGEADTEEELSKMKEDIERQRARIASQQKQIDNQREHLRMLREDVEKMRESRAAETSDIESAAFDVSVGTEQVAQIALPCGAEEQKIKESKAVATSPKVVPQCTGSAHESITAKESKDTSFVADVRKGGTMNEMKDEDETEDTFPKDENVLENEEIIATHEPSIVLAATSDSKIISECENEEL